MGRVPNYMLSYHAESRVRIARGTATHVLVARYMGFKDPWSVFSERLLLWRYTTTTGFWASAALLKWVKGLGPVRYGGQGDAGRAW